MLTQLFVIVGWPRRTKEYGPTYPSHCIRCENEAFYHLVKSRRWLSLFLLPVLPLWFAKYHLVCEICGQMAYVVGRRERTAVKAVARAGRAYDDGEITFDEYMTEILTFEEEVGIFEGPGEEQAHTEADIAETMADLDADRHRTVDTNE